MKGQWGIDSFNYTEAQTILEIISCITEAGEFQVYENLCFLKINVFLPFIVG